MNSQNQFNAAVESTFATLTGVNAAQGALTDAMLLTLHDLLPQFTTSLIQHFEGLRWTAEQGLDPAALSAFDQRAESIRLRLDALQTVPRPKQ